MSNSRFIAWTIWVIASIFYAYQYVLRVMPNIMLSDIMQQFNIDATIFGQFSGIYYIGYSLMHLPIGIMLDRYGPKKVMSSCILLTVIGLLPIIYAENFIYPIIGRALIGMGSSAAILGTFKIIRMTFSEKRFPRMLSFSVTIGLIGAIYGGEPVSYMCNKLGYKAVVEIFAGLGVILAAVTYFIVPIAENTSRGTVIANIKEVLSNKRVILSCLFAGLMLGPMEGFADVWGSAFLKQVYEFNSEKAASFTSMIFIGMCIGAPLLNLVAEKTSNYLATIIVAGIIMIVCFSALVLGKLTDSLMLISFIIVGVCCAYQVLAIYKTSTYVAEHVVGLTTAVANMIIMSFGYFFHSVIGLVIDVSGGTYVSQAFIYGIVVIPAALMIGVIGFAILLYEEKNNELQKEK